MATYVTRKKNNTTKVWGGGPGNQLKLIEKTEKQQIKPPVITIS